MDNSPPLRDLALRQSIKRACTIPWDGFTTITTVLVQPRWQKHPWFHDADGKPSRPQNCTIEWQLILSRETDASSHDRELLARVTSDSTPLEMAGNRPSGIVPFLFMDVLRSLSHGVILQSGPAGSCLHGFQPECTSSDLAAHFGLRQETDVVLMLDPERPYLSMARPSLAGGLVFVGSLWDDDEVYVTLAGCPVHAHNIFASWQEAQVHAIRAWATDTTRWSSLDPDHRWTTWAGIPPMRDPDYRTLVSQCGRWGCRFPKSSALAWIDTSLVP